MYSQPSLDAAVASQAIYGTNVGIVQRNGGWAQVKTPDDYTGWVPLEGLRSGVSYASTGSVVRVKSLFAHIYREPDVTKHAPLLTVPFETALAATEGGKDDPRWLQITLADARLAWIQRGDIEADPRPLSTAALLEFSKRFLGLPYTWGGTSTFGYDCSGFMQMLNRRRGILMPRDAQPQADWSGVVPVARKEDLKPGDLVYFGSSAKHITHTGMYLGEGQFMSATTHETPMVRIDNLNDPYWSGILVAMRRVK